MKVRAFITRFLVVAAASWLLGIAAHAQPPGGMPTHGLVPTPNGIGFDDRPLPLLLHGLNLTDEQRDKISSIQYAQLPAMRDKSKTVRKAHEELQAMVTSNTYDKAKAKALANSSARAMAGLALLRTSVDHQIYSLLTAEQRAQVDKLLTAVRQRDAAPDRFHRGLYADSPPGARAIANCDMRARAFCTPDIQG